MDLHASSRSPLARRRTRRTASLMPAVLLAALLVNSGCSTVLDAGTYVERNRHWMADELDALEASLRSRLKPGKSHRQARYEDLLARVEGGREVLADLLARNPDARRQADRAAAADLVKLFAELKRPRHAERLYGYVAYAPDRLQAEMMQAIAYSTMRYRDAQLALPRARAALHMAEQVPETTAGQPRLLAAAKTTLGLTLISLEREAEGFALLRSVAGPDLDSETLGRIADGFLRAKRYQEAADRYAAVESAAPWTDPAVDSARDGLAAAALEADIDAARRRVADEALPRLQAEARDAIEAVYGKRAEERPEAVGDHPSEERPEDPVRTGAQAAARMGRAHLRAIVENLGAASDEASTAARLELAKFLLKHDHLDAATAVYLRIAAPSPLAEAEFLYRLARKATWAGRKELGERRARQALGRLDEAGEAPHLEVADAERTGDVHSDATQGAADLRMHIQQVLAVSLLLQDASDADHIEEVAHLRQNMSRHAETAEFVLGRALVARYLGERQQETGHLAWLVARRPEEDGLHRAARQRLDALKADGSGDAIEAAIADAVETWEAERQAQKCEEPPPVDPTQLMVTTTSGDLVPLAEATSGATALLFWAPWCPSCVAELEALQGLFRRWDGRVRFAGVNLEPDEAPLAESMLAKLGAPLTPLHAKWDGAKRFGVSAVPTLVLLDAKGVERGRMRGFAPSREATLEAALSCLLETSGKDVCLGTDAPLEQMSGSSSEEEDGAQADTAS